MRFLQRGAQLRLTVLVFYLLLKNVPILGQSTLSAPPEQCTSIGILCLRKPSLDAAREVCSEIHRNDGENVVTYGEPARCAFDLIARLGSIPKRARCEPPYDRGTEALILRQEISEMVQTASLQVQGILAEIDSETAKIRAVHDDLSDRRDRAVSISTLGGAIGTGGGAVGSSLALASKTAMAGNWVGAVFGGVGTVFSFLGYQQQRGPKGCFPQVGKDPNHCQPVNPCDLTTQQQEPTSGSIAPAQKKSLPQGCSPTMLYHLVFPQANVDADVGFHSGYEPSIDNYLNDDQRRETLVQPWVQQAQDQANAEKKKKKTKTNPNDPVKNSPNYVLKTEEPFLFASGKNPFKLSIDDLDGRAKKLADLRAVVARMNRDLGRLTEDLAAGLQCTPP